MYANQDSLLDLSLMRSSHNPVRGEAGPAAVHRCPPVNLPPAAQCMQARQAGGAPQQVVRALRGGRSVEGGTSQRPATTPPPPPANPARLPGCLLLPLSRSPAGCSNPARCVLRLCYGDDYCQYACRFDGECAREGAVAACCWPGAGGLRCLPAVQDLAQSCPP